MIRNRQEFYKSCRRLRHKGFEAAAAVEEAPAKSCRQNRKGRDSMSKIEKYQGIIPAFYACYDKNGEISPEWVRALSKYFVE